MYKLCDIALFHRVYGEELQEVQQYTKPMHQMQSWL